MTDFDYAHFLKNLQFLCIFVLLFKLFRQILQVLTSVKVHQIVTVNIVSTVARGKSLFDRLEFNRLMSDIRSGKIKCLVVRDLSRFGRDYIETGTYLERVFPQIGLRFISVNERYNSFDSDVDNLIIAYARACGRINRACQSP